MQNLPGTKVCKDRDATRGSSSSTGSLVGCAGGVGDAEVKEENQGCALCGLSPPQQAGGTWQGYCRCWGLVWNVTRLLQTLGPKLEDRSSAELVPGSGLARGRTPVICFCCVQCSADPH